MSVVDHSKDRALALLEILAAILIDLLFLAGVLVLNWAFGLLMAEFAVEEGTPAHVTLVIFEWSFMVFTVATVLFYLLRDFSKFVKRLFKRGNG